MTNIVQGVAKRDIYDLAKGIHLRPRAVLLAGEDESKGTCWDTSLVVYIWFSTVDQCRLFRDTYHSECLDGFPMNIAIYDPKTD